MLRGRAVDPLDVHVREVRGAPEMREVIVVGPTVAAEPAPVVRLARGRGSGAGEELELEASGPGMWRAVVPVDQGFLVEARMPNDPEPTAAAGADAPYPQELAVFGPDLDRLRGWAELGDGRVLADARQIVDDVRPETIRRSLRTALLAAALLFYLLGLLFLRLPDRAAASVVLPTHTQEPAPAERPAPSEREAA
jgi:hypothetical protein